MLIQILSFTGFQGSVNTESNTLTQESLNEVLRSLEVNPGDNSVINYSYKTEAGRQTGEFTENTTINTNAVVVTIQMRETKARAYSQDEINEVIAEAKEALSGQQYKALRSSCRDLSQVSDEVKQAIGNYTHYSVASLISAVERALQILEPAVVELDEEQLQVLLNKITEIENKVDQFIAENSVNNDQEVNKINKDLAFLANHFGLILPNHPEAYRSF